MSKVYVIELEVYDGNVDRQVIPLYFTSYDEAKDFLLKDFDLQITGDKEWFILKEDHHYISDYQSGATAHITELKLYDNPEEVSYE